MKHVLHKMTLLLALAGSLASFSTEAIGDEDQAAQTQSLRGNAEAASEAWVLIEQGALLIDVRSAEEYDRGHIEGAINIPHSDTEALLSAIGDDTARKVVLYCGSGGRAGRAITAIEASGYTGLFNATGLDALQATQP